jgi:MoxR-like ATPase
MGEKVMELSSTQMQEAGVLIGKLIAEIEKVIVGQKKLIERILVGLLADGHLLIEGVPGLAKTLTVSVLAQTIQAKFQRIQFTPDLLPADLIGTQIYNAKDGQFTTRKGPIFANLILADEINRAPAKVQSALLEAMQERQVTIGGQTYKMDDPFLVLATQNPIEQEGTYPLPEAQKDRFMLKILMTYPDLEEERLILQRMGRLAREIPIQPVIDRQGLFDLRKAVDQVYLDEKIERYILSIVFATRDPRRFKLAELSSLIQYGASPRATICLALAARAYAFLQGRGYVTPQDIQSIAPDVLRHRVIVSYEAEAEEKTSDDIVKRILEEIEVP